MTNPAPNLSSFPSRHDLAKHNHLRRKSQNRWIVTDAPYPTIVITSRKDLLQPC